LLLSSEAGFDCGAAGARRGAFAAGVLRRRARGAAVRCGAARRTLRLVDRFAVFFFDAFLVDDLRDFAVVFAIFRRFLAMRAPPVEWARILSDKLIARVLILRVLLSILIVASALPVFADQAGVRRRSPDSGELWRDHAEASRRRGAGSPAEKARMPFEKGTLEISVIGGVSLPVSLFRAKTDHQLAIASLSIGRVMAGGPGKGSLELLVDVSPFFQVRQPDLVRGWSVAPLFVRWNFPAIGDGGARIFGEVSASLLFTAAPVPVRTTTFNFMDQAGFGVRFEESRARAWLVGYRFQHISNAGRVKPNPGANFNLVYLGLSFLR
jgi:hypothetical protein